MVMAFVFDTVATCGVSGGICGFDSDAIADGKDVGGATDGNGVAVVRGIDGAGSAGVGGDEHAANAPKKTTRRNDGKNSWLRVISTR